MTLAIDMETLCFLISTLNCWFPVYITFSQCLKRGGGAAFPILFASWIPTIIVDMVNRQYAILYGVCGGGGRYFTEQWPLCAMLLLAFEKKQFVVFSLSIV